MASCVSFPTVVKQGMLFVWPDDSAHEVAAKTPPPITPGTVIHLALLRALERQCGCFSTGRGQALDMESEVVAHNLKCRSSA